jgi:ammonia channel protein AmtB
VLGIAGVVCFIAATSLKHALGGRLWMPSVCTVSAASSVRRLPAYSHDMTIGLRVAEAQEREGLDISLHGESVE